jgi:hypothetical protein
MFISVSSIAVARPPAIRINSSAAQRSCASHDVRRPAANADTTTAGLRTTGLTPHPGFARRSAIQDNTESTMRKILFATIAVIGFSGPVLAGGTSYTSTSAQTGGATSSTITSGAYGSASGSTSAVNLQGAYATTCGYCGTSGTVSFGGTTASGTTYGAGTIQSTSEGMAKATTHQYKGTYGW